MRRRTTLATSTLSVAALTLALLPGVAGAAERERPLDLGTTIAGAPTSGDRAGAGQRRATTQTLRAVSAASGSKHAALDEESYRRDGLADSQRVTRIAVSQLKTGQLQAVIRFAAAPKPAAPTRVDVALGTWDGSSCVTGYELRSATTGGGVHGPSASLSNLPSGAVKLSGATMTTTSPARAAIKDGTWDCAWAITGISVGGTMVQAQGFFAEDLTAPRLSVVGGPPLQGAKSGTWLRMRVEVRNTGAGEAWGTVVKPSGKGLVFSPKSRRIGTLKARSSKRYLDFRVKKRDSRTRKVTYTATASGGHRAAKRFAVVVQPRAKKYRSLSGRYFWGHLPAGANPNRGWDNSAVWFLDGRWAYVGFTKGATKPRCRKTTANCKRYVYNPRSGNARIGRQAFKVTTEGFRFVTKRGEAKRYFSPLTLPGKGARWNIDLIHQDWFGNCLISCTATTERITLGRNGRFVRSAYSVGSWPGIGQSWSSVPPDKRGTYRVIRRGTIEFRYANGTRKRHVIGMEHDARSKPAPYAGLVIGDTNFYWQD